jgi:hypothetical protein
MKASIQGVLIAGLGAGAWLAGSGVQAAQPAGGHTYVEVGYTQLDWSEGSVSLKPTSALVRVGYEFNRNLAAEVLGAVGASSDTFQGVSFKVDSAYGVYLKGLLPLSTKFDLFARAGWLHVSVSGAALGQSASLGDSSLSYGVGAQYHFTNNGYLQGDYASYFDKHGDTIKGPSLSVGYRF